MKSSRALTTAFVLACLCTPALRAQADYEAGGPLAGLKLPASRQNTGTAGQNPELELYPGSVEHWRSEWMHHVPKRSFFDQQSLLKNWVAPNIPGAGAGQIENYASPVYKVGNWKVSGPTGERLDPVAVVRCKAGSPPFKLPLGTLDAGLYAVRIIGAVETAKVRAFREPLYLAMTVNDGLRGETSRYRLRIGYCDEFYSVAEIYFHAPEKRQYTAELAVDQGSTVDLLVRNVTLDDALAGTVREPIKKKGMTLSDPQERELVKAAVKSGLTRLAGYKPASAADRLARDEAIWRTLPPDNAQDGFLPGYRIKAFKGVTEGVGDQSKEQIEAQWGKWELAPLLDAGYQHGQLLPLDPAQYKAFMVNKKLNLAYTIDDLYARKPLPDPYPCKDDGTGLFTPDPASSSEGKYWSPIAEAVSARVRAARMFCEGGLDAWFITGNEEFARDAAVALLAYAWRYPTLDPANALGCVMQEPGAEGGYSFRTRQRMTYDHFSEHYGSQGRFLPIYDELFDYIQGNEDLAHSVARFVPWVKNSRDLIQLLDVYLVQTQVKRIMRYHYAENGLTVADAATLLGDNRITTPWMEWLFSGYFVYPEHPAGLQDLLISAYGREGTNYIGSTFYSQASGASGSAARLERYLRAGGDPKFDLSDPARYPKPLAQCYWQLGILVGGLDYTRIGDVTGPDKSPGETLVPLESASRRGWQWSGDARFAWLLKNVYGKKLESDAEWKKIEAAAATVKRAPWLDNASRVLANWAGILETGLAHDDYRFRRAAYVRTGVGTGHEHNDALDLQVVAHGLPMTINGGQRSAPAYSTPKDRVTRIHNTVEVDGRGQSIGDYTQAWVQALADAAGARYLAAAGVPPPGTTYYRRQVALIDVDEGTGSVPLTPDRQKLKAVLPADAATANSYVFDVFRVSGGKLHTYGFHGPVQDDFQWNAAGVKTLPDVKRNPPQKAPPKTATDDAGAPAPAPKPTETDPDDTKDEANYLAVFGRSTGTKESGDCPAQFQATWRYTRDGIGSEQEMLGPNFHDEAPRKFTRLTLLNAAGTRALRADVVTTPASPVQYRFTHVMLQKRADDGKLESAFTGIIEPYVGEPFISSIQPLPVQGNDADAKKAVAVEVKTKNGHTDICFADGYPEKARVFQNGADAFRVSGEFACYSTDAQGLRQATLVGGTLFENPDLTLKLDRREYTGRVVKADYLAKTLWIDVAWPASSGGKLFEVGTPRHMTSYTSVSVAPEKGGSRIALDRGADFYRSKLVRTAPVEGILTGALELPPGWEAARNLVASNDTMTKFWRVDHAAGTAFKLVNGTFTDADFAPSGALRLWEYGVGDTVRQSTFASLRRVEPNVFELTGNADVSITVPSDVEVSSDKILWGTMPGEVRDGVHTWRVAAEKLAAKPLYMKIIKP